jgi:hypothetical protein
VNIDNYFFGLRPQVPNVRVDTWAGTAANSAAASPVSEESGVSVCCV